MEDDEGEAVDLPSRLSSLLASIGTSVTLTNSDGRVVPVRFIGEQHVREDCRCIPTVADWLKGLPIEPWMVNGVILPDIEVLVADADIGRWRSDVAAGQTFLGYQDWVHQHVLRQDGAAPKT